MQYPLNDHAKAVLRIWPQFIELVDDDVPMSPGETHDDEEEDDSEGDDIADEPPVSVGGEPILSVPDDE